MSSIFNAVSAGSLLFSAVFEIGMHIFVHYTVPGMAFAAWLANLLGVTANVATQTGMAQAVTAAGEQILTFSGT